MIGRVLVLAFLASAAGTNAQVSGEPRQPTAKWVVDFDDEQCVASRNYGTSAKPLFLVIKTPPLGDVIQLSFVRHAPWASPRQVDASIAIGSGTANRTSMVVFSPKGSGNQVYQINLQSSESAALSQARQIAVRTSGLDERLALSAMDSVMKTMRTCVADLREVWHVREGEELHPGLREGSSANLSRIFTGNDYPDIAIREAASGTVALALLIDEAGRVADCTVVGTSEAAALDAQSCAILSARARFKPAVGLDGKPAKSSYLQRITWRTEFGPWQPTRIKH